MIISESSKMMRRSFEKTLFRFVEIPKPVFDGHFGIYIHVPFCLSKCSYCPFYKELFSEKRKREYLDAILKEIDDTDMQGEAKWIYFGGGTPNTLEVKDIYDIVERIRGKVQINSMGIELLPAILSEEYLKELKVIGFTKISIGVESFSDKAINKTGRKITTYDRVRGLIEFAKSLGLWVNVDMMVGLPNQDANTFRDDIKTISTILPDQITTYPYLIMRRRQAFPSPSCSSKERFALIEEADEMLKGYGYNRTGVWTFAVGNDIYDSSGDELIIDYIGFGPTAYSTYGGWKVVNPELDGYVKNFENGKRMGFIAPTTKASVDWRKFAKMVYDLKVDDTSNLPSYIKIFIWLLKLTGYIKHESITGKGRFLAHEITKTVVESLPSPVQNPGCVENYDEYISYKGGRINHLR